MPPAATRTYESPTNNDDSEGEEAEEIEEFEEIEEIEEYPEEQGNSILLQYGVDNMSAKNYELAFQQFKAREVDEIGCEKCPEQQDKKNQGK